MKIDTEFKSIATRLTDKKLKELEVDILANGIREPLVVWAGHDILVDGHHRYAIAQKHGLDFETVEQEFSSRYAVSLWIATKQLERDDLSPIRRNYMKGVQLVFGDKVEAEHSEQSQEASAQQDKSPQPPEPSKQETCGVIVDSEFKDLIPLPSDKELEQLEENILAEGIRDPLVVWAEHNILLDGHNRYAIARKHSLEFKTVEIELPDRDAAMKWIVKNQLGRRNLSPRQASYFRGKLYEMENVGHGGNRVSSCQNGNLKTEEVIAEKTGVSPRTIHRDADFAQAVDAFGQIVGKEAKRNILSGNKVHRKDMEDVVRLATEAPELVDDVLSGKKTVKQINEEREREAKPKPIANTDLQPRLIVGFAENMYTVDDESVDLIITSPPYNLGHDSWPMGGNGRQPRQNGIGYKDSMDEAEYQEWQLVCLVEMYRVAKPGASLFYNHKVRQSDGRVIHPMKWLNSPKNPWTLRQEIIWDRGSTHNHNSYLFWQHDERIYWLVKGKSPTFPNRPIGMSTIWSFHGPVSGTWHPAPFSEELPKRCIEALGHDGITVLDPFAGSCSTVKVALSFGYNAVGIDVNREYLEKAKEENGWICQVENAR